MPKKAKQSADKAVKAEVKKEVKKEVSKTKKSKNWKKEKKEIKKEVKKEVKKESSGPKAQFKVAVTASLGYVSGTKEHGPELKLNMLLHPALCKSPDEQSAFGPLQAAAAQYGLWRCVKAHVRFTPLVGPSAVSGTVLRASANLTQTPSNTSWGGLGARKHRDLQAGRHGTFILSRQDLAGPRDGGWWLTDTNNEGAQAGGPIIEVHALGQTMSTYKDEAWAGDLFIVELVGSWEFSNYTMNPALGSLERHDAEAPVTMSTDAEGHLVMDIASASTLARFMDDPTVPRTGETSTGEVIFQVVDTAATAITSLAPPPFSWLLKGGWWFVKKLAGRARTGNERFQVYASLTDAQNNRPVITSLRGQTGTTKTGPFQVTQFNAPNLGGSSGVATVAAASGFPISPSDPPTSGRVTMHGSFYRIHKPNDLPNLPPIFVDGLLSVGGQVFPGAVFRVTNRVFTQYGNGVISAFANNLQSWTTTPPLALKGAVVSTGTDVPLFVCAYDSARVADSIWFNFVIATNPAATDSFKNLAALSEPNYHFALAEKLSGAYVLDKYATRSAVSVQSSMSIKDAFWLICFLADKAIAPGVTNIRQPTIPSNIGDHKKTAAFGLMLMGGNNVDIVEYSVGAKIWPQHSTRLELLADKLGLSPDDLSMILDPPGSDSYESAVEDESESDSDDDDEDGDTASTSDDFERVPEPSASSAYLNLRENGLTHEQAVEVLKLQQPPPV